MAGASGKKLDDTYKLAWQRGLKTTYYLRTLAATAAEKSTGKGGELNAVASGAGAPAAAAVAPPAPPAMTVAPAPAHAGKNGTRSIVLPPAEVDGPVCMLKPGDAGFEDCEACQ